MNFLFTKTPLYFFVESFWRDEAFTYLLSKKNVIDLISLTARDFNPPLYYLVIHFWMKVFGASEIALRSISFVFYWMTIYCVFLFLTNVMKIHTRRRWLYLLLIALNPILLYYAFEARMYTMLAFFAALSFYSFIRNNYKVFLFATILGLYTHYFMVFVLLGELVFYFFTARGKFTRTILLKYSMPFLFFIPWILFVLRVKDFTSSSFWIEKSNLGTFFQLMGFMYTGYDSGLKFYHELITPVSLGLSFFLTYGIWYVLKKTRIDRKILLFFFIWGIGIPLTAVLISFFKSIFFPRYLIFCSVGLVLLMIYILEHVPSPIRNIIIFTLFLISINFHNQQIKDRKKSDVRRIFKEIKYLAKPDDVVYVTSELDYFTAQYYFDENKVYIYGKNYDEIPDYVGKIIIPKSKFVNALPIYPRKAFVFTSDSHYGIQATR